MIHADERSCFGKTVALDDRETPPPPEIFRVLIERGAARDERPELPAELPVNGAKCPPAAQEMFVRRRRELLLKFFKLAAAFLIALDFLFQRLQNSGHTHQNRNPLAFDRSDDFRWFEFFLKNDGCTH